MSHTLSAIDALSHVPNVPARRAVRYVVRLADGESFTVLVLRGSVPQEKIGAMLGSTDQVRKIETERGEM
jgi:hypothetical protein